MTRFLSFLFLTGVLSSCDDPAQQAAQPAVYYNVGSFVSSQIERLNKLKPAVQKVLDIKGQKQQQTTSDINWTREFELFTQADINKPAFRNSYQISRPDSLTYHYKLKPGEKLTVQSMTVQLDSSTRQPVQIEATLTTNNPLYHSERQLLLESGPVDQKGWQVKHYRMQGFQQLTFFGKNDFFVEGRVQ